MGSNVLSDTTLVKLDNMATWKILPYGRLSRSLSPVTIGGRIVSLRKAKGLNQYRLSKAAKVSASTLGKIENGKTLNPGFGVLERIGLALGVDLVGLAEPASVESVESGRPQLAEADTASTVLHGVGAPLVAEDVAAGPGSLPTVPDDRVYFFHRSYMAHHGWRESDRDRFCCVRLGRAVTASSMVPTIPPKAVLLVDRRYPEERLRRLQRGICLVEIPDEGLSVKRATVTDGVLMLESDNPEPQFHARAIQLAGVQIQDVIRGKVLSWTVEASTRE